MTVQEIMTRRAATAPDDVIFLGSDGGGGFIFIGTPAEYERDIDRVNAEKRQVIKERLQEYQLLRTRVPKQLEELRGMPVDLKNAKSMRHFAARSNNLAQGIRMLATSLTAMEPLEKRYENYQHLRDRSVVDEYKRIEEDGIVVLFDGEERGAYWYKDEYDSGEIEKGYEND